MSLLGKTPKEKPSHFIVLIPYFIVGLLIFLISNVFTLPIWAYAGLFLIVILVAGIQFGKRITDYFGADGKEAREYEKKMKKEGKWR